MPAAITKDPVLAEIARIRDRNRAKYEWRSNARPKQIAPAGDWRTWLVLAGRGFGKTRLGAEWVREQVESGKCKRLALIAPTAADCRDVIVEGESGILSISPPWNPPKYEPSNRRIVWPNGAQAFLFSAEEPERLRGPQFDGAWCDEIAAWQYMQETWDMLSFGLRLGKDPRRVVTTTPKPVQLLRELRAEKHTAVTTGTTYENRDNLAPAFFDQIISKYEGTRLGRQELDAELLDDVPDALWKQELINELRVTEAKVPELRRIVVGVDPAVTASDESDETGIIVVGVGVNNHGYVLADYSLRGAPADWARAAIEAYRFHNADGIVAEVNQGGDMVEHTLRTIDPSVPYRAVRASRGKQRRAEPVSALYEQKRFHHAGTFRRLEEQMTQMTTGEYFGTGSPDHVDALVWAATEALIGGTGATMQVLPEFRPERRNGEHTEALHVIPPADLKPWWYRWISLEYADGISYAHWYCQDADGRMHVYKERECQSVSAEKAGAALAQSSADEIRHAKCLTVWLSEDCFATGYGRKSIAAEVQTGIEAVLGLDSAFLDAATEDERYLASPALIARAVSGRKVASADARIVVRAAKSAPEGGWEYLRGLLRWRPIREAPSVPYDREFALRLQAQPDGADKLTAYLNAVGGRSDEVLPKLLIHDNCPALIRAIPGLSRGMDGKAQKSGASAPVWSLLYGAIAHQAELQNREPQEYFVQRRLDGVIARRPDATTQDLIMAQMKAESDYAQIQPRRTYGRPARLRRQFA